MPHHLSKPSAGSKSTGVICNHRLYVHVGGDCPRVIRTRCLVQRTGAISAFVGVRRLLLRNLHQQPMRCMIWACWRLIDLLRVGQEVVQPRMMEQVVSCRDDIAQQYLMQCVIQGFPDECHLRTLPALLAALPELQAGVRVHLILASLLDRLARCASSSLPCLLKCH